MTKGEEDYLSYVERHGGVCPETAGVLRWTQDYVMKDMLVEFKVLTAQEACFFMREYTRMKNNQRCL